MCHLCFRRQYHELPCAMMCANHRWLVVKFGTPEAVLPIGSSRFWENNRKHVSWGGNVLMFCHHQNSFLVVQGAHASSSCEAPRPRASSEPPVEGRAETLHDVYAASLALRAEGRDFRKSLGSVGHPEFCRKACVYQKFQSCSHGARCQFCHEPHHNECEISEASAWQLAGDEWTEPAQFPVSWCRTEQSDQSRIMIMQHLPSWLGDASEKHMKNLGIFGIWSVRLIQTLYNKQASHWTIRNDLGIKLVCRLLDLLGWGIIVWSDILSIYQW